jgi:hypothetical protein
MTRCDECKFYVRIDRNGGRCRRYPPTIYDGTHINSVGYQPLVDADDWCGEWKDKSDARTPA